MSGDRSLSSLTDDGGVGRRRGGTRNRTSPSGLSVVASTATKKNEKKVAINNVPSHRPRALRRLGAISPTGTGASNIRNSQSQLVRFAYVVSHPYT